MDKPAVVTRPLCVDLDGTLIRTDLLFESLCLLLKRNLLYVFLVPFWLMQGRVHLKRQMAQRISLAAETLPYNAELVAWLQEEKARGRRLILATASDELLVRGVAEHLGIFDEVLASDGRTNLLGETKARLLVERFGEGGFDYVGDSGSDLAVWRHCAEAAVVSGSSSVLKRLQAFKPEARVFALKRPGLKVLLKALRVHQWVKNLLLFLPLVMAHHWGDLGRVLHVLVAFVSFCLCASSVYVLNDLLDLESDRRHRTKCNRPFASGKLPVVSGLLIWPAFLIVALELSGYVSQNFFLVLLSYWTLTLLYTFYFKRMMLLDVIVLASLYTIRIVSGGYAADVPVSEWLLAFSLFMFFSLACVKRYSELFNLSRLGIESSSGRGYRASDFPQIAQFGVVSAYLSVLVLALYLNSTEVRSLYAHPGLIWLVCPVVLYWVSRIWLIAHRGELDEDPIVYALGDRTSYLAGFVCMVLIILAV